MSDETMTQACCSCKWYRKYEGVCTNGDSENVADFTEPDDWCKCWEGNYEEGADEEGDDILTD